MVTRLKEYVATKVPAPSSERVVNPKRVTKPLLSCLNIQNHSPNRRSPNRRSSLSRRPDHVDTPLIHTRDLEEKQICVSMFSRGSPTGGHTKESDETPYHSKLEKVLPESIGADRVRNLRYKQRQIVTSLRLSGGLYHTKELLYDHSINSVRVRQSKHVDQRKLIEADFCASAEVHNLSNTIKKLFVKGAPQVRKQRGHR